VANILSGGEDKSQAGDFQVSSYDLYARAGRRRPNRVRGQDEFPFTPASSSGPVSTIWVSRSYARIATNLLNFTDGANSAQVSELKDSKRSKCIAHSYFALLIVWFRKDRFLFIRHAGDPLPMAIAAFLCLRLQFAGSYFPLRPRTGRYFITALSSRRRERLFGKAPPRQPEVVDIAPGDLPDRTPQASSNRGACGHRLDRIASVPEKYQK